MHWMAKWPGGFPLFVADARGSRFTDVDGLEYADFCLGDTGAMSGHAPEATIRAVAEQAARGITTMLPTEDALWVGEELTRRFGVPRWQFALTATDANRFVDPSRAARHGAAEGPRLQLVLPRKRRRGVRHARRRAGRGAAGQPRVRRFRPRRRPRWSSGTTSQVSRRRSRRGDVALVLTEPALTNVGIVHPEPGFHDALRDADARHRDPARDRRDAHDLLRPRRLHEGARARTGPRHDRQADRRRHSCLGVRVHRRAGRPGRRVDRARGRRRRRSRRHARGERALARGDARDARRGAHRRGVRANDPARGALRRRASRTRSQRRACRGT